MFISGCERCIVYEKKFELRVMVNRVSVRISCRIGILASSFKDVIDFLCFERR